MPYPTIHSFFGPESNLKTDTATNKNLPRPRGSDRFKSHQDTSNNAQFDPTTISDGFTTAEKQTPNTLLPKSLGLWLPPRGRVYPLTQIAKLSPGPNCVQITGKVVSLAKVDLAETPTTTTTNIHRAKGWWKLRVRDDTGLILVKLFFRLVDSTREICLGAIVGVWTSHVCVSREDDGLKGAVMISIFPEKDPGTYFECGGTSAESALHTEKGSLQKLSFPLGYTPGAALPGLISLKAFLDGGHEIVDQRVRVLVCVRHVGTAGVVTPKTNPQYASSPLSKLSVRIFDDTASSTFTLWGHVCISAHTWRAGWTVLLISDPAIRSFGDEDAHVNVSMGKDTTIDIDPNIEDTAFLRGLAKERGFGIKERETERLCMRVPEGVFGIEAALSAPQRVVYTVADLDRRIHATPEESFIGFITIIILELHLYSLWQKSALLCTECKSCNSPIQTRTTTITTTSPSSNPTCPKCTTPYTPQKSTFNLNPRCIGTLIDESGGIPRGKMIWSDDAIVQLFGQTANQLAECTREGESLRDLETRLLFERVWLLVGWKGDEEVGKLCALRVGGF